MNEQKQIEEMALDIWQTGGIDLEIAGAMAIDLYEQDYRKVEQGEWKVRGLPTNMRRLCEITHKVTCTKCGFDTEMLQGMRYNYCPHCGAKMKGE